MINTTYANRIAELENRLRDVDADPSLPGTLTYTTPKPGHRVIKWISSDTSETTVPTVDECLLTHTYEGGRSRGTSTNNKPTLATTNNDNNEGGGSGSDSEDSGEIAWEDSLSNIKDLRHLLRKKNNVGDTTVSMGTTLQIDEISSSSTTDSEEDGDCENMKDSAAMKAKATSEGTHDHQTPPPSSRASSTTINNKGCTTKGVFIGLKRGEDLIDSDSDTGVTNKRLCTGRRLTIPKEEEDESTSDDKCPPDSGNANSYHSEESYMGCGRYSEGSLHGYEDDGFVCRG